MLVLVLVLVLVLLLVLVHGLVRVSLLAGIEGSLMWPGLRYLVLK